MTKAKVFKTLDALPVTDENVIVDTRVLNYMELNNKLIEETYTTCKRREYVQLHMDETDLAVLDNKPRTAVPMTSNTLGSANLSRQRSNMADEDEQEELTTNVDIGLLINGQRLTTAIPSYENHARLYFEDREGFVANTQELRPNQRRVFTKIQEEKSVEMERKLLKQF